LKTKIIGKFVIGHNGNTPVIHSNGCVVFESDTIIYVGESYLGEAEQVIDAGNAIISPGFIDLDALGDIDHAILDSYQPPHLSQGLEWSEEYFNSERKEIFSKDEEMLRRKYAFVQLILNGVTTALPIAGEYHKYWAESYEEFQSIAEIAAELGLRVYLGPSYRSGVTVTRQNGGAKVLWDEAFGNAGLQEAVRFIHDFDGKYEGLVRGFLAPARIQTCTIELLKQTRRYSDELNCPVRLHACQEDEEILFLKRMYDETPLSLLSKIGFLGPRTLIPHATHVGGHHPMLSNVQDELHLLGDTNTTVVHCPVIESRYGAVLNSFEKYQKAGINIALGTDTFPPDMIRVMDLALNLNKIMNGNQWSLDPGEIFNAATVYGANALGREDLGRLAPGAKADIIIVNLDPLRTGVVEDPIRTLIMNTSGWNINTVIINGKVVMENGEIPGLDQNTLRKKGQAYFDKMRSAYTCRDYKKRSVDKLFPPVFETAREAV